MENAIYNDLIRRGYSVDVGVVTDRRDGRNALKEIDFVVNDGDRRIIYTIRIKNEDEKKIDSELDSFKLTKDFFKKIVVRNDISHNFTQRSTVYHCSLVDFLLNKVDLF